ncbi:hypothetical protein ACFSBU_08925 [Thalassotalea marina]|uniref:Phage integrase family protein n=2 Tax=Thalassotalea marina TaxID=1673741 RepID=A0A919BS18_9GAMM|nr:hypothetical protein GCM10017161_40780 [Thalassotalea marina]
MSKKSLKISKEKLKRKGVLELQKIGVRHNVRPLNTICHFQKLTSKNFDVAPYYGRGYDDIVTRVYYTIQALLRQKGKLQQSTIHSYLTSGFRNVVRYLEMWSAAIGRSVTLNDITQDFIENYVIYLKSLEIRYVSQKTIYTSTKSLLVAMHTTGYWQETDAKHLKDIFPKNPYPNINHRAKRAKPFSDFETRQIVVALKQEIKPIYQKKDALDSYELMVCLLSIAMQTGLNLSSLINMKTDSLSDHPLKKNRKLLTVYKKRGNATHLHTLRSSTKVELVQGVKLDVSFLIEKIIELNHDLRIEYDTERLLVFKSKRGIRSATYLSEQLLARNINTLIQKHKLIDENSRALVINFSRIRRTFSNRLYELSGQNILIAAQSTKHHVNTADNHYLVAPEEAKRNIGILGEIRVKSLTDDLHETPVAKCKDNIGGHKAPKNGTYCVDFLGCFRCKSFVVTSDDLYRIFSFYWAIVRNRESIGHKNWKKYLRSILNVIDNNIAPQFHLTDVLTIKEKARQNPHPYWKSLDMLRMGQ